MIKCKNCGYENNNGSQICLHCREKLTGVASSSNAETYIRIQQEAISQQEATAKKVGNRTLIVMVSVLALFVIGVAIYLANLYKPVVDKRLLGSWSTPGTTIGYAETLTFQKNGTLKMTNTVSGTSDWYYHAKDGTLKISILKNIDKNVSSSYTYQFGTTEDGRECLLLTDTSAGTLKTLFCRID